MSLLAIARRGYVGWLRMYERRLRQRVRPKPGVTIVTVSFNSLRLLPTTLAALDRFAPEARVLVVDNNSKDGSAAWLRSSGRDHVILRSNIGHGGALDLGVLKAGTEFFVTLDVDAFPISDRFLPTLIGGLRDGATVIGASSDPGRTEPARAFAHPCCLAMRLDRFVERHHSFRPEGELDVGERISRDETAPRLIDATSIRGPGAVGTVFGEIVYHNYSGTRFTNTTRDRVDWVGRDDPLQAWDDAVERYLS